MGFNPEKEFQRAKAAYRYRNYEVARLIAEDLVEERPDFNKGWHLLARIDYVVGDHATAFQTISLAHQKLPNDPATTRLYAFFQYISGFAQDNATLKAEAIQTLETLLQAPPNPMDIHDNAGKANVADMLAVFLMHEAISEKDPAKFQRSRQIWKQQIDSNPQVTSGIYCNLARSYLLLDKAHKAVSILDAGLKRFEKEPASCRGIRYLSEHKTKGFPVHERFEARGNAKALPFNRQEDIGHGKGPKKVGRWNTERTGMQRDKVDS